VWEKTNYIVNDLFRPVDKDSTSYSLRFAELNCELRRVNWHIKQSSWIGWIVENKIGTTNLIKWIVKLWTGTDWTS
jgi:hypothetical protein